MKTLILFLVYFCLLFSDSSSLQCYTGNLTNLSNISCSEYSSFCAIYKYRSGTFDTCNEQICKEMDCTDNAICKEPGISYQREIYGMKYEMSCCEEDLCNLERFESAAPDMNSINLRFVFFLIVLIVLLFL